MTGCGRFRPFPLRRAKCFARSLILFIPQGQHHYYSTRSVSSSHQRSSDREGPRERPGPGPDRDQGSKAEAEEKSNKRSKKWSIKRIKKRRMTAAVLLLVACVSFNVDIAQAFVCPNQCNHHGVCIASDGGTCQCFPGYYGVDCSYKLCPSGNAWFDHPSADNVAHADFVECSNAVCIVW